MFDQGLLEAKFARIGARLKTSDRVATSGAVALDVWGDRDGEFFEIARRPGAEARVEVLDVRPADRHLLLLVREHDAKHKFLCGHDERHWFVAAVPGAAAVGTVTAAKEALKPAIVRAAQATMRVGAAAGNRRKNAAFRRQGEWFFLRVPNLVVPDASVLRDEPISRGNGSKPHRLEFCYRVGGELVYVCDQHRFGVSTERYRRLLASDRDAKRWNWQPQRRNAAVFARGRVRHADHKTIVLRDWHRVVMNTEHQAEAMRHVAFLD